MHLLDRLLRFLTSLLLLTVSAILVLCWFGLLDPLTPMLGFRQEGARGWGLLAGVGALLCAALAIANMLMPRIRRIRDKGYVVQRMGDDLLARARFAQQQDGRGGIRRLCNQFHQLFHLVGDGDDVG